MYVNGLPPNGEAGPDELAAKQRNKPRKRIARMIAWGREINRVCVLLEKKRVINIWEAVELLLFCVFVRQVLPKARKLHKSNHIHP